MPTGSKSAKETNALKWQIMNNLIDNLRMRGFQTASDIAIDIERKHKISRRTLQNYLSELIALRLLTYNSQTGQYQLTETTQVFENPQEYQAALDHSKKLLDTLNSFLPISIMHPEWYQDRTTLPIKMYGELLLVDALKKHFQTGFPKLSSQLADFEQLVKQRNDLAERLHSVNPKIDKDTLADSLSNYWLKVGMRQKNKLQIEQLLNKLNTEEKELLTEVLKSYLEICRELTGLTISIEHGKPLPGTCTLCPAMKIKKKSN